MMHTTTMTMLIRSGHYICDEAITTSTGQTTTTTTTWNLYENPMYNSSPQVAVHHERLPEEQLHQQEQVHDFHRHKKFHSLRLPVSARKMATSFWDLTFIRPSFSSASIMKKNLEHLETDAATAAAQAEITALKTELDYQRKARKKMKLANKRLSAELSEEKKARKVLERICEDLGDKVSAQELDMERMRRDMEDERKTLRVAEVFREERVRMKFADAKFVLDSKLLELDRQKAQLGILLKQKCMLLPSSSHNLTVMS